MEIKKIITFPLSGNIPGMYENYIVVFKNNKTKLYNPDTVPVSVCQWIQAAEMYNVFYNKAENRKETHWFNK